MADDNPITLWIDQLRQGDELAARNLWEHFFRRLHESTRLKLKLATRPVYDEEDAAQSAFRSVFAGIVAGRFPDLQDRGSLWHLLLVITARKVAHRHRHDQQLIRDTRKTLSQSIFSSANGDSVPVGLDLTDSREPSPEFAAEFAETCESLFQSLDDDELRQVVTLRMEGFTDGEIATKLNCSRRTVQRRLEVIRRHWDGLELSND